MRKVFFFHVGGILFWIFEWRVLTAWKTARCAPIFLCYCQRLLANAAPKELILKNSNTDRSWEQAAKIIALLNPFRHMEVLWTVWGENHTYFAGEVQYSTTLLMLALLQGFSQSRLPAKLLKWGGSTAAAKQTQTVSKLSTNYCFFLFLRSAHT